MKQQERRPADPGATRKGACRIRFRRSDARLHTGTAKATSPPNKGRSLPRSTLTTRHTGYGKECDDAMGIPAGFKSYAILPIGWPMGNFGSLGRGPLSEVVYLDDWGKAYPGLK